MTRAGNAESLENKKVAKRFPGLCPSIAGLWMGQAQHLRCCYSWPPAMASDSISLAPRRMLPIA